MRNDYDKYVYKLYFQLFIVEHSDFTFPKYLAVLHLGQSRWEDKEAATKIRGSSTLTKTLLGVD